MLRAGFGFDACWSRAVSHALPFCCENLLEQDQIFDGIGVTTKRLGFQSTEDRLLLGVEEI